MKIGNFTTPTGATGNVLSPSSWINMILGVIVFLVAFAIGQNITRKVGERLPIDTTIDPIAKAATTAPAGPAKQVF